VQRIALLSLVLAAALAATAEEAPEKGPNAGHEAYGLYQELCGRCHGVQADGNGPQAALLQPRPPDLTRLRGPDGAAIGREELMRVIDGRRTLRAHGAGEMPVWGWVLVPDEPDADLRERVRIQLVQSLADYIVSIQRPSDDR